MPTSTDAPTTARASGADAQQGQVPGGDADRPQQVPPRGWLQIVKRGWAEAKADNVPLLAAGVAFYTFLSIVPALTAVVFIYGLVADPQQIATQVDSLGTALPADVRSVLTDQLTSLASNGTGAGIGAVVSVLLALWSASGGMNNLMTAVSLAYDEEEKRSFLVKRGLALLLTVGGIVLMVVVLALIAALPLVLRVLDDTLVRLALQAARYVLLVLVITVALAVLYRLAPDRDAPKLRWVSVGAGVATLLWLLASIGFSLYAAHGSYSKYGALASVVVLLFWLWITAYAILLGAEINAEAEQQTIRDTTRGPAEPLGRRGAVKADSVPEGAGDAGDHGSGQHDDHDHDGHDHEHDRDAGRTAAASAGPRTTTRVLDDEQEPTRKENAMSASDTEEKQGRTAEPTVAELVRQLSEDSGRLVRGEIQLAKLEVIERAKGLGVGVGALGAAGVLALFGLGALIATAIIALALVLPAWLAALIVTVVIFAAAGVAALVGRKKVAQAAPPVPEQAIAGVKQDVATIKESAHR